MLLFLWDFVSGRSLNVWQMTVGAPRLMNRRHEPCSLHLIVFPSAALLNWYYRRSTWNLHFEIKPATNTWLPTLPCTLPVLLSHFEAGGSSGKIFPLFSRSTLQHAVTLLYVVTHPWKWGMGIKYSPVSDTIVTLSRNFIHSLILNSDNEWNSLEIQNVNYQPPSRQVLK